MSGKDSGPHKKKASMSTSSGSHRTSASYEETIVHGKKRKVWRSTASNTANMMSPEAAANYLQQAAEAAAAAAAAAAGSGGESVQITLGPNGIAAHTTSAGGMESLHWMNPSYAAARAGASSGGSSPMGAGLGGSNPLSGMGVNMNMSMNMNLSGGHPTSVSFGNLDLAALAKAGDLSALTSAAARNAAAANGAATTSFPTSGFGTSTGMMSSSTLDPRKAAAAGMGVGAPSNPTNAGHCASSVNSSGKSTGAASAAASGKESLPCSEAEMKALMSMFVEIMGMSMDTEKLGKSTAAKKRAAKAKKNGEKDSSSSSSLFTFGDDKNGVWPDPAIAAATGDLDALNAHRYAYSDDEDDEDDSLPDLDDMKQIQREQQQQHQQSASSGARNDFKAKIAASAFPTNATPITGRSGIAPVEWESLEQVAIEDAMEAEERARKAAKRREKKNRKKEKARKEAAAKAAEAAAKKREKAILSWRSRVVSACQSNEVQKLKTLIEESPLTSNSTTNQSSGDGSVEGTPPPMMTMATMTPHLEFLLPHTVAKNRTLAERGNEARTQLAHYLMDTNLPLVFTTPLRTGRTALHTACLYGELAFVEGALQRAETWTQEGELSALPVAYLSITCQESGFAPIHYAVLSGSKAVLEILLKAGADVKIKSTDTHTWKSSTGKGIAPRELAETISHGSQDKVLETHGLALQEALGHFSSSDDKRTFKQVLERMVERLKSIEQNGYSPPPPEPKIVVVEEEPEVLEANTMPSAFSDKASNNDDDSEEPEVIELRHSEEGHNNGTKNKKKKKKNKKKGQQQASDGVAAKEGDLSTGDKANSATAHDDARAEEDPLVAALLGMGFTEEQIHAAVKACGGTDRATADDLVVWILGEGSGESPAAPEPIVEESRNVVAAPAANPRPAAVQQAPSNKPKAKEPSIASAEARVREVKAAAKKEEEAKLKEQRLAAKREEKIRRNREWNNRAQARQKEEEQAKIAQAVAEANRAASQRAAQAAAVQHQQQLQKQLQQQAAQQQAAQQQAAQQQAAQQQAAQQQVQQQLAQQHAQQQHLQQQQQKAQQQQLQQQPQPLAAAKPVLAPASAFFPGGIAPTAAPGIMPAPQLPAAPTLSRGPPPPGHYGAPPMPPPSASYEGHGPRGAQGTTGNIMAAASRAVEAQQQGAHPRSHAQPTFDKSNFNHVAQQPPAGIPKMPPQASWEPPNVGHGPAYTDVSAQFPPIADDATVSSFGSGRVAAPAYNATIPPGFRPTPTPPTLPPPPEETASVASFEVEENPLGEMRATAREFVPTGFSSRPSSRNATTMRHSSSLPTASATSLPPVPAQEPATGSRLRTFSGADIAPPPAVSSNIQANGLLGGVNGFGSSFLAPTPGQHLTASLDRLTAVTPSTEHLSPVPPSAATSVTGVSNADEPQLPAGLGLEKGASDAATRTPVILEGLSSNSFDGASATHGVSSIWGGLSAGNGGTGNATRSSVAGIPLAGLPSLSLTSTSSTGSTLGPRSNSVKGESALPSGLVSGWGASNLGGASGAGGSIW